MPRSLTTPRRSGPWPRAWKLLVAASDAVVIGRVTSTSFALEDREFTSGTHSFGDLTAQLRITAALKGDTRAAGTLEVRQFAHAFNGKLLIEDKNPPLEEGQAYLLFLVRDSATGVLRVGDPFIQQVIDGRVYWAGAKPHLQANDPGARPIGNDPRDPLMAFWGLTVEQAAALVRAAVR